MSIIISASIFVVGICVGGVIMGLLAAGGRDERRVEVRDALRAVMGHVCGAEWHCTKFVDDGEFVEGCAALYSIDGAKRGLAYLAELLDMRSILDSWKTCETGVAPAVSTGDGGQASDAPATVLHESGTVGVAAGSYVKQSIASR